jgi:tetratricopeptide (TPR) repeat protein
VAAKAELKEALDAFRRGDLGHAQALAEEAVSVEPSALWQHLLGLIHCRKGEPATGVDWLRRACSADPGNLGFRLMLIRALIDSGSAHEALELADRPSGTGDSELAAWHVRAEAAEAAGRPDVAAEAWQTICLVRPKDWRAWANLADALARQDRWGDAASALLNSTKLNPDERSLRYRYAGALARAGSLEESAEQLRRVLEGGADDFEIRLALARIDADLGRHEEALNEIEVGARLFGVSIEKDLIRVLLPKTNKSSSPRKSEIGSVRELALLLERTNRMDAMRNLLEDAYKLGILPEELGYPSALVALRGGDAERARELLLADDPGIDPVRWHALMARIAEASGDAGLAFSEAEAMHAAVRDQSDWIARAGTYLRKIGRFAAVVNAEWTSKLEPIKPGPRASPVFLVGFPRSGTTLLDTFLRGHPDVCVVEEQPMLDAAEAVIGDYAELPSRSSDELEKARQAYFAELDRHIDPAFEGSVIDKLPLNMLGLPIVYSLFPDARVIFAQRHPCDTVLSCFLQGFAINDAMACFLDIHNAAQLYDISMRLFSTSRDLLPLKFHTLVYEELVRDPEAALRPAIEFLSLDWRAELLDHQSTAKSRGTINTPSYAQVVMPLSKLPAGRWRRYQEQLKPVLPTLLPWAERFGYRS